MSPRDATKVRTISPDGDYASDFVCACGAATSKVVDSRGTADGQFVRRRRECLQCHARFTTYECREHPAMAAARLEHAQRSIYDIIAALPVTCVPPKG